MSGSAVEVLASVFVPDDAVIVSTPPLSTKWARVAIGSPRTGELGNIVLMVGSSALASQLVVAFAELARELEKYETDFAEFEASKAAHEAEVGF